MGHFPWARLTKPLTRYALALGIVFLAFFLRYGLIQGLGMHVPTFTILCPAIVAVAVLGGLWPGLFATALCVLGADFLALSPAYSFRVTNLSDAVALAIFAVLGVLISLLADRYRQGRETIAGLRQQEQMRNVNAELDLVLASMSDAVYISDEKRQFIHANDAFATFHRFQDPSECFSPPNAYPDVFDLFLPGGGLVPVDDWPDARALRGESGDNVEFLVRRKDTGASWLASYNYAPLRDRGGEITGSVVVCREIGATRRAQAASGPQSSIH
jgi:PAS domain-containing protein